MLNGLLVHMLNGLLIHRLNRLLIHRLSGFLVHRLNTWNYYFHLFKIAAFKQSLHSLIFVLEDKNCENSNENYCNNKSDNAVY